MLNFDLINPVKILFGKGKIANLADELPANANIMMLYGGGSIKKNGIYEQVTEALKGFDYIEYVYLRQIEKEYLSSEERLRLKKR